MPKQKRRTVTPPPSDPGEVRTFMTVGHLIAVLRQAEKTWGDNTEVDVFLANNGTKFSICRANVEKDRQAMSLWINRPRGQHED